MVAALLLFFLCMMYFTMTTQNTAYQPPSPPTTPPPPYPISTLTTEHPCHASGKAVEIQSNQELSDVTERTYSRIKTRPAPTPTPTPAPTPSYVDAGADETYESIAEAGGPSPGTLRMMEALSAADDDDAVDEEGDAAYAHSYSPVVFPPAMEAEVVDAELVPHNQAEIIHAVSPFKVDSRITQLFEPLPNTLSPEQAEILLVLRGAFSKSRANLKPSLEFYPSEFEDWAVECFSGQRPDEKKTFAVFFETFMSDGANVLRNDAIQVLGKMRYHDGKTNGSRFLNVSVVLRDTSYQIDQADVHCAPLNGKQHYPLLYNHLVFMSIKTIISMVAEQYGGIEYEDPIKHLLARFYSRHDPLETAYRFLHGSFQTTTCQHTWNCILENVLAFSLNGNNVEERYQIVDEVMSTMFRREMMIDTLCFTKVLKFHATFGNPKQGLGLLKLITAKQRMYIPPESWSDISSLYEQTSSFKVAYGLLSSLKERCIEEFGHVQMRDCLKFQKFSFTRVDRRDERFPELQRGDLRKAVLPIKFTINLFMNLLHLSAVQGNLEALLEDVKEYFKWYGSKRTHDLRTFDVADPPYSEMSRNSAVLSRIALCKIVKDPTEGIAFLKDYVFGKDVVLLPDILVIISDILSKYIRDLVKEEKAVLRKKRGRGHGTIPLSGEQTEAQKLAIYLVTELNSHVVDAAGMRTSKYRRTKHAKASLTSEPLYSLCVLKMALHSESASLVNDCFREHYQSCKRIAQPVDGGLVIKTMKLYGANGWWRTAESLVYDLFPARRRQRVLDRSSGTSYFKIINELIAAHVSSKKEALDPLSSRSMRVIELAFQTVVKGDVLEYQHLSEVLKILAARGGKEGDAFLPIQNQDPYIPVGISPSVYLGYGKIKETSPSLAPGMAPEEMIGTHRMLQESAAEEERSRTQLLLEGKPKVHPVSGLALEMVQYAVNGRRTISDDVILNGVRAWLSLGTADTVATVLVPNLGKLLQTQALFVDAVLECCETKTVAETYNCLDEALSLEENTAKVKLLMEQ